MGGKLSKKRKGYDVSDPKEAKEEAAVTATKLPVEEPAATVESVSVPEVVPASVEEAPKHQEPEPTPETVTEPEVTVEQTVLPATVPEPEPVAELAAEPLLEQAPEPEQTLKSEEPEPAPEPELEPEKAPEPEPEQVLEPEPEQKADIVESAAEQQAEVEPEPTVATSDITLEAGGVEATVGSENAAEVHTDKPVEEESVPTEVSAAEPAPEPEAAEPVPEIVISESVSASEITAEPEEVAETSAEEVPSQEPEVQSKMENGNLESPSVTEDVAEVDALPAVNGECTNSAAMTTEECVNGNEKPEEAPIKEQSDFELKKDVNVSGDVQEVPDAVPDMVDGLGTEVTQAV
ncbi:hypothetical protein D9C73_004331 [Collichthys lucidus]|uniref:Brain abundant, membrane attached signal protein 1 n=1 Tax=Collichthys lucidus TaxID=240159 RepID=A0A4U5U7K6_COLLU|nr:hypothetical protein D9C73_004331 [Collichthys lucidus]